MKRPVICAIDAWERDAGAIHTARELAHCFRLPLLYVHVVEPSRGEDGAIEAFALLRHALETTAGIDGSFAIQKGHPADRIVALADERDAAYVVLGCRGPRASLLGSISADVARRASCPVLVVPPGVAPAPANVGEHEPTFSGGIVRFDLGRPAARTTE